MTPKDGNIQIKCSRAIKRLSLRMAPGKGVWVNVPPGTSDKTVLAFIEANREWIEANRLKIAAIEQQNNSLKDVDDTLSTKFFTIKICSSEKTELEAKFNGKIVNVFIPTSCGEQRKRAFIKRVVDAVYEQEAKKVLLPRIKELAEKTGLRYSKVNLRNNVSNWGSCSFDNNISLNIQLMKVPYEVIDYVIIHELCHIVHKNHSSAFWELVHKICPNFQERRQKLRTFSTRALK